MRYVICFLTVWVCFSACKNKPSDENARLRIGQFLGYNNPAIIIISKDGKDVLREEYRAGLLTHYHSFSPGIYRIRVLRKAQPLLEKKVGLGPGGIYTLCLTGTPLPAQDINKQTVRDQLMHLVEGAAGITKNGYLPQLLVLNDYFSLTGKNTGIRFLNMAEGMEPVDVEIKDSNADSKMEISHNSYPLISNVETLQAGKYSFTLTYSGGPGIILEQPVHLEPRKVYTFFITGACDNEKQVLKLVSGSSKN
ncbi:MAG TPA: hypothetical protein DCG19_06740 [Cryomorphaceae bacterium]|nr:hypothetical protein [Cryomorphaceae bacterium]